MHLEDCLLQSPAPPPLLPSLGKSSSSPDRKTSVKVVKVVFADGREGTGDGGRPAALTKGVIRPQAVQLGYVCRFIISVTKLYS